MKKVVIILAICLMPFGVYGKFSNDALRSFSLLKGKVDWTGVSMQMTITSVMHTTKTMVLEYLNGPQNEDTLSSLMKDIRFYLAGLIKSNVIAAAKIDVDKDSFINKSIMSFTIEFEMRELTDRKCQMTFSFPIIWDEPLETESGL